jgi:hypothetical protein
MQLLAQLMMSPNEPTQNRTLAGLQLKNCLSSRDEDEEERKHDIWRKVDVGVRDQIKKAVSLTLFVVVKRGVIYMIGEVKGIAWV